MSRSQYLLSIVVVGLLVCFTGLLALGEDKPVIVYIPKGVSASYWAVVHKGCIAGAGPNYEVQMIGPPHETNVEEQIDIVNDMIQKGVAGILLIATDQEALVSSCEAAKEAGVPLITLDSGVNSDAPLTYIATDNIKASSLAAYKLAELVGYMGKVLFVNFYAGSATASLRAEGFLNTIAEFPDIELIGPLYSGQTVEGAMDVVADVLAANPDLAGVFGAEAKTAEGCARQVQLEGADVRVVGFDAPQGLQDLLDEGIVDALVAQQPYGMGFLAAKTLVEVIEGRVDPDELPSFTETSALVVTNQNKELPKVRQTLLSNLGIVEE